MSSHMKRNVISVLGLTLGLSAMSYPLAADDGGRRIWACRVAPDQPEDLWLVEWGVKSYVKLYGNRLWSKFSQEGDERRWDFDRRPDGLARYTVVLKSDLTVDYYDFSSAKAGEELAPAYQYRCREAD